MSARPLQRQSQRERCVSGTVHCLFYFSITIQYLLLIHHFLTIYLILLILSLSIDADKKHAEDLTSLATLDIEDILAKTQSIGRGVLLNVCQSLLKEWGADSLGVLPEDMMQELITGVTTQKLSRFDSCHPHIATYSYRTFCPQPTF